MKSRLVTFVVIVGSLVFSGLLLGRWADPVWQSARERQPALRLDSTMAAAGQGVTLALLGGFRALVADGAWIRMYVLWETHDLPATETLIRLVATIDPRPVYFWLNGARILAYDFPVWRIQAAGGFDTVGASEQEAVFRQQGEVALRHLGEAMAFHPASADLWIERANIQLNRLKDLEGAAESYRRAWEQPRAPYYAARMHAELLRRAGRKSEALEWLVKLHPTLPPGDEGAGAEIVLGRIRDLERELRVSPEQAYRAPR